MWLLHCLLPAWSSCAKGLDCCDQILPAQLCSLLLSHLPIYLPAQHPDGAVRLLCIELLGPVVTQIIADCKQVTDSPANRFELVLADTLPAQYFTFL